MRPDFSSDSPTVSVSSQVFENTSTVSIDQQLNKMPQFVSGQNQITSATDGQATPTSTPGIATANLRGLGANRTLVLLDGRRTQPANASLVVDLNTIPQAAIDSVEIITGGAGSTYGADAVAGVVNFKLKKNFQGVTISGQSGQTLQGDGAQSQISMLLGSNFADNKGNAIVGLTWSKRDAVFGRNREFFRRAFTDPSTPGADGFPNFGGYVVTPGQGYSQTVLDQVFGARGYVPGDVKNTNSLYFNPAATTAQSSIFSINAGSLSGRPAPGYTGGLGDYDYKYLTNGNLASNAPGGYLSSPLERYAAFANGHYDFNDYASVYAQVNFQNTTTTTQGGASSPAVLQWSVNIPFDAAHPVPDDLRQVLLSRAPAIANSPWNLNKELDYMGQTRLTTKTNTYELLAGVRGNVGVKDWTYDFFASHGVTDMNQQSAGYVDLLAYQTLIALPNYGANADFNNGRTGLLAHCTSGLNPFVTTPVSQDCINIINAPLKTVTDIEQEQIELDIQGALFAMPAGDFRFAFGMDYRKNTFDYEPDRNISTQNINSLTIGLFDTTRTTGQIGVKEAYAEALVPILKDIPAIKALSVNLGYRFSDYDTQTGGVSTWKATADWDINDYVKIRGGRQNANRAPNVAELFQPAVFTTVPWPDHDPCSIVTRAPYGNVAGNTKPQAGAGSVHGAVRRLQGRQHLQWQPVRVLPARPRPDSGQREPESGKGEDLHAGYGAALTVRSRSAPPPHGVDRLLRHRPRGCDLAGDDADGVSAVLQRPRNEPDLRSEQSVLQAHHPLADQRVLARHERDLPEPRCDQDGRCGHADRLEHEDAVHRRSRRHVVRERQRGLAAEVRRRELQGWTDDALRRHHHWR